MSLLGIVGCLTSERQPRLAALLNQTIIFLGVAPTVVSACMARVASHYCCGWWSRSRRLARWVVWLQGAEKLSAVTTATCAAVLSAFGAALLTLDAVAVLDLTSLDGLVHPLIRPDSASTRPPPGTCRAASRV